MNISRRISAFLPRYGPAIQLRGIKILDPSTIANHRDENVDKVLNRLKEDMKSKDQLVTVEDAPGLAGQCSGVPTEHLVERVARIFSPARSLTQSGSNNCRNWRIEFDFQDARWENHLIGWTSTGDPLSNSHMDFTTCQDAINYCERQGYQYTVEEKKTVVKIPKSYAANFHWNKNSRTSSK